jgi:ferredoxin
MFSLHGWASKEIIMFSFRRWASKGKSKNAPAEVAPMKVRIEKSACAGNARCAAVSAELFPLTADGYIDTSGFDVPKGKEQLARRGARACPERIITIIEDDKKP